MIELKTLLSRHAKPGVVDWIGVRPARRDGLIACTSANITESGLEGDHGRRGKRAVTLIQAEHLDDIARYLDLEPIAPETLRRNLVISGLNLSALRGATLSVGHATLRITTVCAPCSRMEEALGHGGYNAMRGHGGWCCEVITPGRIALNDPVRVLAPSEAR